MDSKDIYFLKTQIGFSNDVIRKNIEGITSEQALVFAQGQVNSAHWVLGHLIYIRNFLIELLGGVPIWNQNEFKHFDRGQKPLEKAINAPDFELLKDYFQKSEGELERLFSQGIAIREENKEDLVGLVFHESYHAGQLGIIRKLLGKKGTIS